MKITISGLTEALKGFQKGTDAENELHRAYQLALENNLKPAAVWCSHIFYVDLLVALQIKASHFHQDSLFDATFLGMRIYCGSLRDKFFIECDQHRAVVPRGKDDYVVDYIDGWEIFK